MKHMTQKEVRNRFKKVYTGALEGLLTLERPAGWNGGVYGWNCDIYFLDGVAYMVGNSVYGAYRIPYEITQKYAAEALKIKSENYDYQVVKEKLRELREKMLQEVEQ